MLKYFVAVALALAVLSGEIHAADPDPEPQPEPEPEPQPKAPKNKKIIRIDRANVDNIESKHGNTVILAGGGATTVRSINQLLNGLDAQLDEAIENAILNDPSTVVSDDLQGKLKALAEH